jgi:hypothetical protein
MKIFFQEIPRGENEFYHLTVIRNKNMPKIYSFISVMACLSIQAQDLQPIDQPTPVSSQFEQGDQGLCKNIAPGYEYPARINLKNSWNAFATVSYLYWYAGEEGMDLATTSQLNPQLFKMSPSIPISETIWQSFKYSSGFKVGLGYTTQDDDWVVRADYTRLHLQTHTSKSVDSSVNGATQAFLLTNWFYQTFGQGQTIAGTQISSSWHLGLDWLDAVVERPFYSGRKLTITPFMGLRSSWISQTINIQVEGPVNGSIPTQSVNSHNNLHSWGIGPRLGVDGHFLLGAGVRIQGEVGGSLLFTQFSKVFHSEDPFNMGPQFAYEFNDYNTVRPMAEANLGFG